MSIYHELLGVPTPKEQLIKQTNFEAFKAEYVKELNKARSKEELLDMLQWLTSKTENFNP